MLNDETPDAGWRRIAVQFPRKPAMVTLILTFTTLSVMAVWMALTKPAPDPVIAIVAVVIGWSALALLKLRPPTELIGDTVVLRALLWTRRIQLGDAQEISVRGYWNGSTALVIKPARGRRVYLPLVVWNDITPHRGLTAVELDDMAAILAGLTRGPSRGQAIRRIQLQAEHLRAGGSLKDSPLRPKSSG